MTRHGVTTDERVRVDAERRTVPRTDALAAYLALAGRFGRDQVCLLESAGGPERDSRRQYVAFGVLLTVSVTRGEVRVDGAPDLRATVLARLARLDAVGTVDATAGTLRLNGPRALWPVLREVRATFDAQGSASEFRFGFLAYFGYDAGRYVEDLPWRIDRRGELPDVHLVLHQGLLAMTAAGEAELTVHQSGAWPRLEPDEVTGLLTGALPAVPAAPGSDALPAATVEDDTGRAAFAGKVARSLAYIAAGDIYQVQIGHELAIRSPVDPLAVYLRLRRRNPSPYMYLSVVAGHTVIGASPELFARVEDGVVTMRPIAGTIPRGAAGEEEAAARTLSTDPKERAEHTMLVDLCRNDLGRICRPDALSVPDRFVVERYSHVLHLVSTVAGTAEQGTDAFDVIAALFPAGTMTGTPKIRSMEIIEELEHSRRGLYAGALGLIDVGGHVNMALCIRTLIHHDGVYTTRASAGVVADSVAAKEWTETLAKMSATYWAVTGKELLPQP